VLNAANEVAVAAFLERKLGFRAIADVISRTLTHCPTCLPARLKKYSPRMRKPADGAADDQGGRLNPLFYIAAFALALGILITVHELGHYSVARLCGVKVLRFSIGFGRPL
jgi:hypothetical protein